MKNFALILSLISGLTASAFAADAPVLAPVDPLAWAVANTDWGHAGGGQVDSLRKIVNGQVAAHQVSSSYTDPVTHAVMRVKCSDPANCIVCSKSAGKSGRELRDSLTASSSNSQAQVSMATTLAAYANARANALNEQAKWNDARNKMTVTETTRTPEGETQSVTKTVTVENSAAQEAQKTAQVMQQLGQASQANAQQQQGSLVSSYVSAATGALQKPAPATVLLAEQDPLK